MYKRQTDVGPLIRESDAIRVSNWIEEAVHSGARLLCGGERKGSIVSPTVLTSTKPDMKVNCQEIFGPVVTVEPYQNFDEALRRINNSNYGLQDVYKRQDLSNGSGQTTHLAVGAGKDSNLYLVNRDSMGKFSSNNSNIYQELAGALPGGVFATPAYFNLSLIHIYCLRRLSVH